jgi:hypothetical protein
MTTEQAEFNIKIDESDLDEDRFISIWNIASTTMDGEADQARMLASKFIGFLCKHRFAYVVVSPTDATYLDEWYERDNKLLNDWSAESDKVDVITQHAHVSYDAFLRLLTDKKFSHEKNYSPTRANRVDWFTNDWNVG